MDVFFLLFSWMLLSVFIVVYYYFGFSLSGLFATGCCISNKLTRSYIFQTVKHNAYGEDPYAKEFGIKISEKLAQVEARVLPAPWVMIYL